MLLRAHFTLILIVAFLPLACRTYGGYGSEEATLQQIEAAYETFERDLAQAQNDLRAVTAAADTSREDLVGALQATVAMHEVLLERHRGFVEGAREHPDAYRHLSRTFRGMISEQETVYRQYRELLQAARAARDTTAQFRSGSVIPRPHVVPPYYERMQNASQMSAVGGLSRATAGEAGAAADTALGADRTATDAASAEPGATSGSGAAVAADTVRVQ